MELTAEQLERFRQSGLAIDREGEFWHEGATVTHHGLKAALWRWLDWLPDPQHEGGGRTILRLDEKRFAYIDVADAPLIARSLRWEGATAVAVLNDGSEERADFSTLHARQDVHYLRVRKGLEARLSPGAWNALGPHLHQRTDGVYLDADGQSFKV